MIKAIETRYGGCRFRSRLEARWAVFFDALGIEWEYEPQGFEVTGWDQTFRYLPDFYLPKASAGRWEAYSGQEPPPVRGVYVEVKGETPRAQSELNRLAWMVDWGGPMSNGLLLLGPIPRPMGRAIDHPTMHCAKGLAFTSTRFTWTGEGAFGLWSPPPPEPGPNRLDEWQAWSRNSDALNWMESDGHVDLCAATGSALQGLNLFGHRYSGVDALPQVENAYRAAKSARFEHGESG